MSSLIHPLENVIPLLLAAFLDYAIADPQSWIHPVRVMGWSISAISQLIIKYCHSKWQRRLGGTFLGLGLIIGSAILGYLIVFTASFLHPWLGIVCEIIILASCFAGRSLNRAATEIMRSLECESIAATRLKLSKYVGRDTQNLSRPEILRAILETVAENATDGVTAPLFYAICGALIPGLGSVPLALAYKAASTLDSMVGYRHEPYTDIGWFSAQLEDRLTWLPCRLTVLTLAIVTGTVRSVWKLCWRDASQDPSPNSGWSECAYAAILGVQLGGTNFYGGVAKNKPLLGNPLNPITSERIERALYLTRTCFLSWLILGAIAIFGLPAIIARSVLMRM